MFERVKVAVLDLKETPYVTSSFWHRHFARPNYIPIIQHVITEDLEVCITCWEVFIVYENRVQSFDGEEGTEIEHKFVGYTNPKDLRGRRK